jgi:hypothetical protein
MNSFEQVDAELAVMPSRSTAPLLDYLAAFHAKDGDLRHGKGLSSRRQVLPFRGGAPQVRSGKTASSAGRNEGGFAHRAPHPKDECKLNDLA